MTPRLRHREIGRRAHFQRTAALAATVVLVWVLALVGLGAELWFGRREGAMSSIVFWMLVPFLTLLAFDRMQTSIDRSCGGSEH